MNKVEMDLYSDIKSEYSESDFATRLKCGEILLMQDEWKILFSCNMCDLETQHLDYFLMHSLEHHLSVEKEGIDVLVKQTNGENEFDDHEGMKQELVAHNEVNEIVLIENSNNSFDGCEEEILDFEVAKKLLKRAQKREVVDDASSFDGNDSSRSARKKNLVKVNSLGVPVYTCEICDKRFRRRDRYITHVRRHKGIKPYTCEFCDATFVDLSNCNTHRKRHLNIRPHVCAICSKGFISTTELKFHTRTHTGERPHECTECDRCFKTPSLLNKHLRRHTNERPHVCATCGKRFYDSTLLKDHEISHTNDRPFACELCDTKFSRRKALLQHMKLHSGVKQYTCEICFKAFAQGPGLYSHMKIHHRNKDKNTK